MYLESVSKFYYLGKQSFEILKDITYKFKMGNFYAIMGESGAGKSTLISILGLLENITSGKYLINEHDVANLPDKESSEIRMKHIGFVFQDFNLDENLKAYENVMIPMLINKTIDNKQKKEKAIVALDKVGLKERVNHLPKQLSGGEKQRVAIARALANDPEIILADEPTGNLDSKTEKRIFEILKKLSESGKCVIVVSHSDVVKDYADTVLELCDGRLVQNNGDKE